MFWELSLPKSRGAGIAAFSWRAMQTVTIWSRASIFHSWFLVDEVTMKKVARTWAYETSLLVGSTLGPALPYNDYYPVSR